MSQEIDRIYGSPDGRGGNKDLSIWIYEDNQLDEAMRKLLSYYTDIALPYFNRYHSLQKIDDIINNPPFDHNPAHVGGAFDNRCMKGLIVAKMVGSPEFDKLVKVYDEEIKGTLDEESIQNYYVVRDYLKASKVPD